MTLFIPYNPPSAYVSQPFIPLVRHVPDAASLAFVAAESLASIATVGSVGGGGNDTCRNSSQRGNWQGHSRTKVANMSGELDRKNRPLGQQIRIDDLIDKVRVETAIVVITANIIQETRVEQDLTLTPTATTMTMTSFQV